MYKKLPQTALVLALSMVFLWITFSYLLPISLPFLLGGALALLAEPVVRLLSQRFGWKPAAASSIGVSGICLLSATILTLLTTFFMRQLRQLTTLWPQLEATFTHSVDAFRQWLSRIAPRMPNSIHTLLDQLSEDLLSGSDAFLSGFLSRLPQMATGVLGNLSELLFGLITGIISGYMISIRLPRFRQYFREKLPPQWQQAYLPGMRNLKKALAGWVLAELKLALVAFVLLLAGFFLLRLEHSLMLAVLITLVDAFPVLGVGTVLLPWSILRLIQGDQVLGFGLLGLYAVIWLIRSVLEPKLLGKGLGLDSLVTLLCIYAGFRLWGISGMLLAPIVAMAVSQVVRKTER